MKNGFAYLTEKGLSAKKIPCDLASREIRNLLIDMYLIEDGNYHSVNDTQRILSYELTFVIS